MSLNVGGLREGKKNWTKTLNVEYVSDPLNNCNLNEFFLLRSGTFNLGSFEITLFWIYRLNALFQFFFAAKEALHDEDIFLHEQVTEFLLFNTSRGRNDDYFKWRSQISKQLCMLLRRDSRFWHVEWMIFVIFWNFINDFFVESA